MFNLFFALATVFAAKEVIKEKIEPIASKETRFDWEAYWTDVENGISAMEQVRKRQRGEYMTTKQIPVPKEIIPKVIDMKRYQNDKQLYGETTAEMWRKCGFYMTVR